MLNFFGKKEEPVEEIITQNKNMLIIIERLKSMVKSLQPILITGETGVGKELFARYIHRLSDVKGKLVVVNVAGLDDNMFSDTLFGHSRGAFTGADIVRKGMIEQAASGTLFLDEIGDLSISSQVKLLRLLEQGEYLPLGMDEPKKSSARIITATNQDLWKLQREGKFRKDLNFRLRTHHIHIPPLRERKDDLPQLTDSFLAEAARALKKKIPTTPPELFTLFNTYSFPGNIRELRGMIFDALSQHNSNILSLDTFKSHIERERDKASIAPELIIEAGIGSSPFAYFRELPTIRRTTQMLVAEAMHRAKGNQSIAARMLGISQPALSKRLKNEKAEQAEDGSQ
jgi:transcriptional regulator with PAS, ATPase and Fis domain